MSLSAARFAPVPAPPDDPGSLLLSGRIGARPDIGWRVAQADGVEIEPSTAALVLGPSPVAARWMSEADGTFGGLRLPPNIAVTPGGGVLLLDGASGALQAFDPCACRFVRASCVGIALEAVPDACMPPDAAARQAPAPLDRLRDPGGIAVCGQTLYIADAGHARVLRYAWEGLVPRDALRLPASQRRPGAPPWRPTWLAVDGHGTLLVADPTNGRLDRFAPDGRWLGTLQVGPGLSHLAVDCRDRVRAVVALEQPLHVVLDATPLTVQIDGGSEGFHWRRIALQAPVADVRFAIDLACSDTAWSAAELADAADPRWQRWRNTGDIPALCDGVSPPVAHGRYLRVRFVPQTGHVPGASLQWTFEGARVVRIEGDRIETVPHARADRVAADFPAPPLRVDARGHVHLHCADGPRAFDGRGMPVPDHARLNGERHERLGRYRTDALDSGIDGCQWHRIELRGAIPPGCRIEVRTTTAAIALDAQDVEALPDAAWSAPAVATRMAASDSAMPATCAWDCLITSPPGRYAWVQLILHGDGRETPCVDAALVEYPRISLRRYLPAVFGFDPVGADFTDRFTALFDTTLRSIEGRLDRAAALFDPRSAPADAPPGRVDFLSWLAGWIGIALAHDWPVARRRHYVREAARLYPRRGTVEGLRRQLLLLLGFDRAYATHCLAPRPQSRCLPLPQNCGPAPSCLPAEAPPLILEHFRLRRWLYAGHARLGDDSMLWGKRIVARSELSGSTPPPTGNAQVGSTRLDAVPDPLRDPFHVTAHKFSVFVPARIRDVPGERNALLQLITNETPAHTQADVRYVEPRFRVGVQAMVGLDSVVARTPCGVRLDEATLRHGTVLGGHRAGQPRTDVGDARVGTTAVLN